MFKNQGPVYYSEYLKLDHLLNAQHPLSRKFATPDNQEAHDEMLFIIVHQAYELWFKQIIHELNLVLKIFNQKKLPNHDLGTIHSKLERIKKIQSVISGHLDVLETMTPMDFLEFRNLLIPASGFQSVQFREIEIKMGLKTHDREAIDQEFFLGRLNQKDRDTLIQLEQEPTLLNLLENWLERMPFTERQNFNFWQEYAQAVNQMLDDDEALIRANAAHLNPESLNAQIANLNATRATFESLIKPEIHNQMRAEGKRKLSHKATLNALFILLYRDQPLLTLPFHILTSLMDIDENFTAWRYRHALMAQRMLGSKIGTGGTSGHQYLKRAAEKNRAYLDLFNLSTFLVPRSLLPKLPESLQNALNFNHV
jgi:tryptophan 2,3-dioxygenase